VPKSLRHRLVYVRKALVIKFLHQLEPNGFLNREQPHRRPDFLNTIVQTNRGVTTAVSFS